MRNEPIKKYKVLMYRMSGALTTGIIEHEETDYWYMFTGTGNRGITKKMLLIYFYRLFGPSGFNYGTVKVPAYRVLVSQNWYTISEALEYLRSME